MAQLHRSGKLNRPNLENFREIEKKHLQTSWYPYLERAVVVVLQDPLSVEGEQVEVVEQQEGGLQMLVVKVVEVA